MKHIFVIVSRVTNSDNMPYGWVSGKHVNKRNTVLASERNAGILFEHFKGKLVMLGKMLSISSTIKKNAQKECSKSVSCLL